MKDILKDAQAFSKKIEVDLQLPRIVERQMNRSNPPTKNFDDYWRISLLIPYLDSVNSSLEARFSDDNIPAFSLQFLHPSNMFKTSFGDFKSNVENFYEFYELENVGNEIELWHELWKSKTLKSDDLQKLELSEVIQEANDFFPSIKLALNIAMALPCTTCTIERSFSTLRRVKTWLRSTMTENRLNGNELYSFF